MAAGNGVFPKADGDRVYEDDVNFLQLRRKQFSDATERTDATGSFVDTATVFTFTAPVNSMVIGITLTADIKSSNDGFFTAAGLKVNGTNLGTKYYTSAVQHRIDNDFNNYSPTFSSTENTVGLVSTDATTYEASSAGSLFIPFKVLDASTTITVRLRAHDGTKTGYIKNVVLDVYYFKVYAED